MKYRDGLLCASLTLSHGGRMVTVDNVIVDTGAADEDDVIVRRAGVGGFDYAVRKIVDTFTFAGYTLMRP